MKLQTPVDCGKARIGFSFEDRILVVGSCFADNIGQKMVRGGFDVCVNPFGTLYNPVSVCNSLNRLSSSVPFSAEECVEMGAGAGLVCSFSHNTSFARRTGEEFLENANAAFAKASDFYKNCNKVIITLGTSWCYLRDGEVVSNCLKRDAKEFTRSRLTVERTVSLLSRLIGRNPDKSFIFTVSPIRHLKDTAHGNQLSKSVLLLAVETLCSAFPDRMEYFPSYEIVLDELRDYRFYAEDMIHPSDQAVGYIWERFTEFGLPEGEKKRLLENEKSFRKMLHKPMH